jgi:hypothetical protein
MIAYISVYWFHFGKKTEFSNRLITEYEYSFMWWWTDTPTDILPEGSARCVQSFDDSLDFAIRMTYRISLRSSSLWEPRHPLLKVLISFFLYCMVVFAHTHTGFMMSSNQIRFNQHFLLEKNSGVKMFWYTRILMKSIICIVENSMWVYH